VAVYESGTATRGVQAVRPLTVAGAALVRTSLVKDLFPQLPVELQRLKTAASTNACNCSGGLGPGRTYNLAAMPDPNDIAQITSRVDRLLLRHAELQRTNDLLTAQLAALSSERDLLRSRLSAARARIDALLDRLPEAAPTPPNAPAP